jgi:hypothetical protein
MFLSFWVKKIVPVDITLAPFQTESSRFCEMKIFGEKQKHLKNGKNIMKRAEIPLNFNILLR